MKSKILKEKSSFKMWPWIIAGAAILSYGLSVANDYALDDFIVIVKNNFTQRGFSGIWKILSNDTFAGMSESNIMVLSGGRYRPLSLVTFAIERELFTTLPSLSHFINVCIYAGIGLLLFNLLKRIFAATQKPDWAELKSGLISLLFISLPAHSESVINIKGRDDLLCLLFFLIAAIQLLKYIQTGKTKNLFYSSLSFFLSLMSKETALTFVLIFPLLIYFFTKSGWKKSLVSSFNFFIIALLFLFIRYLATKGNHIAPSNEVLNNFFVKASTGEKYATILLSWLMYVRLFFFPVHLSYDYNFNEIPLTGFGDWRVLFSLVLQVILVIVAIRLFKRKSIYSFSILFYFITFSIFSNLFFNIGTIFADRFIFISSLGLCIIVVAGFFDVLGKKISDKKNLSRAGMSFFITVSFLFMIKNINRCFDWKDNNTLFISDVKSAPGSVKAQLNAGIAYVSLSEKAEAPFKDTLLYRAINHNRIAIDIYPTYPDGYLNTGVAYSRLGLIDSAETWWNIARKMYPTGHNLSAYDKILCDYYYVTGLNYGVQNKFQDAISNFHKALRYDSLNADVLYNLGGAFYTINQNDSSELYFRKALIVNPNYQKATQGLQALQQRKTIK